MAQETVKDLLEYIESFEGHDAVIKAADKTIAGLSDIRLEELAGSTTSTPAPSYTTITTLRKRNPYLPEMAKRRANGVCQLCGIRLDYTDSSGRPYLEAHHIIPLADDGADELSNMVALCPNCHRKMHIAGTDADIEKLRQAAAT